MVKTCYITNGALRKKSPKFIDNAIIFSLKKPG
jgi:hypothetical protein